jgi:hypothetical protein
MAKKSAATDQAAPPEAENLSTLQLDLDPAPPATAAEDLPAAPATEPAPEPVAVETPTIGADEPALLPSREAVQLARQRGYEVSDNATDEDFWSRVETNEERAERLETVEREAEQLRQRIAQYEAQQQAAQAAPVPKPAAAQATTADDELDIPERPAFDRVTLGVLQVAKENGLLKAGVGGYITSDDQTLKPYIDKYNAQVAVIEAYDAEWTPRKVAETLYEKRAAQDRAERETLKRELAEMKQHQAQAGVQAQIDAYFGEHKAAYFDLGPDGKPVWDPQAQTYRGEGYARYMAAVQEAYELGATDPVAIHRYAAKHAPPVAPSAPAATPAPAEKVVLFRNRLKKNNGHADTLATPPVSRPAASPATRSYSGMSVNQALDAHFSDLMSAKVADRM